MENHDGALYATLTDTHENMFAFMLRRTIVADIADTACTVKRKLIKEIICTTELPLI
jgi:hypothetical protein